MDPALNNLQSIVASLQGLWDRFYTPWSIYQVVIIVVGYLLARLIAKATSPRLETQIRKIRGKPGLLRLLVSTLRNLRWIVFFVLMMITLYILREMTWPSRSYFIYIVTRLSLAWVVITILSKIIRNRSLSRAAAAIAWAFAAIWILGQLDNVTSALDSMALTVGDFRLSALKVLNGLVMIIGLLWLAGSTGRFLDRQINRIDDLTPSLKVLSGKIIKIVLIVTALLIGLSSIGIDLTALTIFSGAVGVGIGFGLQKVVSNFISGVIILLDKSIKPGDTISLDQTFGWIRELRARFVSVVTRDGKEFLIPNEDFITQKVVNWSFSDSMIRIDVAFGVSYDSDPHEVSRLAIAAAETVERVSTGRAPVCWMTEFGDSSLNFLLRFWISDPQNGLTNIRGKVLLALWDILKEHKIGIPFPHRELIFRNAPGPIEIVQRSVESDSDHQPQKNSPT